MVTKIGTAKSERITGTTLDDSLFGRGGADTLFGLSGRDRLYGEDGDDAIFGGEGADLIFGGAGNDTLYGASALDRTGAASKIDAVRITTGLDQPVFVTSAPGDSKYIYTITKDLGQIVRIDPASGAKKIMLDLPQSSFSNGGESGLLGLAFHPDYKTNGKLYIYVTAADGDIELRSLKRGSDGLIDPASSKTILTIPHKDHSNHNGGWIGFGPKDGYLYIAVGDGGGGNDASNNAQNTTSLLGKMLRIDVDTKESGKQYGIPDNNPFVGKAGADEIWAYGLRNPWRSSFDKKTGDLYIADVGQNAREEVNVIRAGSTGGENFGWRIREGLIKTPGIDDPAKPGLVDPVIDHSHSGWLSITGGYVIRNSKDALQGTYIYADFVTGKVASFVLKDGKATSIRDRTEQIQTSAGSLGNIASFGEGPDGKLYAVSFSGAIFRLDFDAQLGDSGDTIRGGSGADKLYGGAGKDQLFGESGSDSLVGGTSSDRLNGGADRDILTGNTGADRFIFSDAGFGSTKRDVITDFQANWDKIELDNAIFAALGKNGALKASLFKAIGNGVTADSTDKLIYSKTTGLLSYDADGAGVGAAGKSFAELDPGLSLKATDFIII